MRLHTILDGYQVGKALQRVRDDGHATWDVVFTTFEPHKSRTHPRAYEIQLGTYHKDSLPEGYRDQHGKVMHVRRFKNSGDSGATSGYYEPEVWAATWYEWGWFMLELFKADPSARWGSEKGYGYKSLADFHAKT